MQDVVALFGLNLSVTMETAFSTLEHTVRMLRTTGQTGPFGRPELERKGERLKQAIAVVLEDSLSPTTSNGHSGRRPTPCVYHEALVRDHLAPSDNLITFNYDCVLDYALRSEGSKKWNARHGYGFRLGTRGYKAWQPRLPAMTNKPTVHLYKLHGSLHFQERQKGIVQLKQRPYTKQNGSPRFTILPPESAKAYEKGIFPELWAGAASAIHSAHRIVVIGYSLPLPDLHSTALLRTSVRTGKLTSLVIVNPDKEARHRIRSVLQRGLSPQTRVMSFDYLKEFVALDRTVWRV